MASDGEATGIGAADAPEAGGAAGAGEFTGVIGGGPPANLGRSRSLGVFSSLINKSIASFRKRGNKKLPTAHSF